MRLSGAFGYYKQGYDKIPGWFWPEDYDLFDRLLGQQLDDDVRGDLLEIGTYHGKSAILMGYGLRDNEELLVCDLFGAEATTAEQTDHFEEGFGLKTFSDNYSRFHAQGPIVHARSSLELRGKLSGRMFRFIHIDGGHAEEVATYDIGTAAATFCEYGVIAIDDYRTHHTPGVGAAIWASAACEEIYPFALSETKVYAAGTQDAHDYWLNVCRKWGLPGGEEHQIFGKTVLRMTRGAQCEL